MRIEKVTIALLFGISRSRFLVCGEPKGWAIFEAGAWKWVLTRNMDGSPWPWRLTRVEGDEPAGHSYGWTAQEALDQLDHPKAQLVACR